MDKAELIEEVRKLQDRVDELEEQQSDNEPQPLSPTRRSLLGGLTGGGIGLLALLSASSPAAAATDQLGSPSRRIDFYGGTGDFTALEANETITDKVTLNEPNPDPQELTVLGDAGGIIMGRQDVVDDGELAVISGLSGAACGIINIQNFSDDESAVVSFAGTSVNIQENNGNWSNSDTDGNNCVFHSSGDLIYKNRKGGTRSTNITGVVSK